MISTVVIFGKPDRRRKLRRLFPRLPRREYALAILLPFAISFVARFFLTLAQSFGSYNGGIIEGLPFAWSELFTIPRAWMIVMFPLALFEEVVFRGYLQTRLAERIRLRRAVFLAGIVWALFQSSGNITGIVPYYLGVSSSLVQLLALVLYSIPLGWTFARRQAILPVTLMHATIGIMHEGRASNFYLNHQDLAWLELLLWIVAACWLFKRYPPRPEVIPAESPVDASPSS